MYETCRGFCGIAVGDSILLSSSCEMHYCHIAPVETSNSTLIKWHMKSIIDQCK
jgi:hypothetical protein